MANEVLVKVNRTATIGGQAIGGLDELVSADYQAVYKQTISSGVTNYEIDFAITIANDYVEGIHATQNLTVKTNSTSAPDQTIALSKNVGQVWTSNQPTAQRVFTTDVTKFYVTNASGADALLLIGVAGKQAPGGAA